MAQSGAGQKTAPLFGIYFDSRNGAPVGTSSQRTLYGLYGQILTPVACLQRRVKPIPN